MHEDENADMQAAESIDLLASGSASAAAPIDLQVLNRLRELDPQGRQGLLQRVLSTYASSLTTQLQTIEAARDRRDAQRLALTVHALKSSSAAVGAVAFSDGCAEIERFVRDHGQMPASMKIDALVAEGHAVLAAVRDMLSV